MSETKAISVAIDGPAGAGKSTVSRMLAEQTNFELLDTGAMYRAFAWLDLQNAYGDFLARKISDHIFEFDMTTGKMQVVCDGRDITDEIRSKEVTAHVSKVAADAEVRKIAVNQQQKFIQHELMEGNSVILEGRDIGTIVLPDASIKFFLTASPLKRAERRASEIGGDVVEIADAIAKRDELDSSRTASPLMQASDAQLIDASNLEAQEVVDIMMTEIAKLR